MLRFLSCAALVLLPLQARAQSAAESTVAPSHDGYSLPPEALLPPPSEAGMRVVSAERRELWQRYEKQSYGFPITLIVAGAVPLSLALNDLRTCEPVYCDPDAERHGTYFTVMGSAAATLIGSIWLSVRVKKRREIRREIEQLNERERFRVQRLKVQPQVSAYARGAQVGLTMHY